MFERNVILETPRRQERAFQTTSPEDPPVQQGAGLHEEVYRRETTDRELLYGNSFLCEWCRMSNLSPDDFE